MKINKNVKMSYFFNSFFNLNKNKKRKIDNI